jgi:predicted dehydrogenase/threonine dehydrogenase-like Zn-dependent dehydrogenase
MKQIVENLKSGEIQLVDVPAPIVRTGHVLIRTESSVVSSGTERMLLEFGKAGLVKKARQQPDKVRQVLDKIKTDGLSPTIRAIRTKLDQPLPLGYSQAGKVIAVGDGVEEFDVGDKVASNGYHADVISVPQNLCARIPEGVSAEEAAFTVLGSIALQGVRLAQPTLGETFAVVGVGLIGLLTVQLLQANGCQVIGIDVNPERLKIAAGFGADIVDLSGGENPVEIVTDITGGRGADGVIIAASTASNEPVQQAANMCRKKGRIVLVGVTGLELSRSDFYEKELQFHVSCSYGPGRYDDNYELKGHDYPIGYVRWTEKRNFEAVLDLMCQGKLKLTDLISHRFIINEAPAAYERLFEDKTSLGVILTYSPTKADKDQLERVVPLRSWPTVSGLEEEVIVGVIGAGNYAGSVLLPNLARTSVCLKTIVSAGGTNSTYLGRKFRFEQAASDSTEVMNDREVNTVVIATQHDTHAELVVQALKAGKKVFVEKPLALSSAELLEIKSALESMENPFLMVGFNRRFAPHIEKMNKLLATVHQPMSFIMTVNAGAVPDDHWVHDVERGGGRIIGEACHFVDLLRYLSHSLIKDVSAVKIGPAGGSVRGDKMTITLKFENGSFGSIHYLANGHRRFPKERLEVFCGGRILQLDNFIRLRGYGWPRFSGMRLRSQDKGHRKCMQSFIDAVKDNKPSPIPFEELFEVTQTSFNIVENAK